ncbi:protein lifeguard 1 isoform X1 [Anastrepha obliqua]|uniref:protein lifeguard 1 isoform X1 n=1 Tax=Anastrepha obliqua TaxID=95512 RepID=UPI00240A5D50|nr:protein lifeguard 1 isoform X1 [Anastrepha obliqua]
MYAAAHTGDNYGAYDAEGAKSFSFDEESVRKGFIRKVYSILMVQLLITFGFITVFIYVTEVKDWVHRTQWIVWVALAILLVTMICMACCEGVRRKTPLNFIFLLIFTLAESFLLGIVATYYGSSEVMLAVGITAAVCLALTLFAFQTKWDFTMCGGVLLVAIVVFLIFGIVAIFIPGKVITLVYSSLGALLFSIYLVYDTQLMMGGKHKYAISPEEYIFAALNLYLDIINIFTYILAIIGATRG